MAAEKVLASGRGAAAERRAGDPHLAEAERATMRRLAARHGLPANSE